MKIFSKKQTVVICSLFIIFTACEKKDDSINGLLHDIERTQKLTKELEDLEKQVFLGQSEAADKLKKIEADEQLKQKYTNIRAVKNKLIPSFFGGSGDDWSKILTCYGLKKKDLGNVSEKLAQLTNKKINHECLDYLGYRRGQDDISKEEIPINEAMEEHFCQSLGGKHCYERPSFIADVNSFLHDIDRAKQILEEYKKFKYSQPIPESKELEEYKQKEEQKKQELKYEQAQVSLKKLHYPSEHLQSKTNNKYYEKFIACYGLTSKNININLNSLDDRVLAKLTNKDINHKCLDDLGYKRNK